jgi:phosphotriesterase-related protein
MDRLTVEELTDVIVRDIAAGADGTRIRSGVIGEVGVNGDPVEPNELKSIRASARASRATGAPISFHAGGHQEEKLAVLDAVEALSVFGGNDIAGEDGKARMHPSEQAVHEALR